MKRTFLCVAMSTVLTAGGASTAFAAQTTLPGLMQPDTVILYDDAGEASILSGGYIASEEQTGGIPTEIVPGMKVVYDANGELNNIYYVDDFCPEGYTIHGNAEHTGGNAAGAFLQKLSEIQENAVFRVLEDVFSRLMG